MNVNGLYRENYNISVAFSSSWIVISQEHPNDVRYHAINVNQSLSEEF